MYASITLLLTITFLYAGYNLFIKISSGHVADFATSTILATIALQLSALIVSCAFVAGLLIRGNHILALSTPVYAWAAAAGVCIGVAEIGYFYLFRGVMGSDPIPANIAIPCIVGGTTFIAMIFSWLVLQESMTELRFLGGTMIIGGVIVMFMK